ncbi:MAG: C39 family peptidase [Nitrospirota bacterium]
MRYNYIKVSLLLIVFILILASTSEAEDVCAYECGNIPIMECDRVTIGCTDFKILKGYAFYYCIYRNTGYILVLYKRPVDTFWLVLDWGYEDTSAGKQFMYNRMIQVAKDTVHWWCPDVPIIEPCPKSTASPSSGSVPWWCPVPEAEITLPMTVYQCAPEFKITPPEYDFTKKSLCKKGCALAALTMVLNYYLNKSGLPMVDLVGMNEWMKNNGGFYSGGDVYFPAISRYPNANIFYDWKTSNIVNTDTIDNEFKNGRPVILTVKGGGHFVVAIGKENDTYKIIDPGKMPQITTLKEKYNNVFDSIRIVRPR